MIREPANGSPGPSHSVSKLTPFSTLLISKKRACNHGGNNALLQLHLVFSRMTEMGAHWYWYLYRCWYWLCPFQERIQLARSVLWNVYKCPSLLLYDYVQRKFTARTAYMLWNVTDPSTLGLSLENINAALQKSNKGIQEQHLLSTRLITIKTKQSKLSILFKGPLTKDVTQSFEISPS